MPIIRHINARRRKAQNAKANQERGTARERGYTAAWDRFAKTWLANNPLCVYCLAQDRLTTADLVDHVEPHRGDPEKFWPNEDQDSDDFFASCCNACHNGPKQSAEKMADKTGKPIRDILRRKGMWVKGVDT